MTNLTDLTVHVSMGQIEVSNGEETILETFVGSCVALCIYDSYSKVGCMAHIMLPERDPRKSQVTNNSAKYADDAIENMLRLITAKGAKAVNLRAKMAGGANMFLHEGKASLFNIGERNVFAVRSLLKEKGIPLLADDTGMNYGRNVHLVIKSGEMIVSSRNSPQRRM